MMLVPPGWFIERGLPPEQARASALQAERADVYKVLAGWGDMPPPRRWFTHAVLPPDPRPRGGVLYWDADPWAPPDPPEVQLRWLDKETRIA